MQPVEAIREGLTRSCEAELGGRHEPAVVARHVLPNDYLVALVPTALLAE